MFNHILSFISLSVLVASHPPLSAERPLVQGLSKSADVTSYEDIHRPFQYTNSFSAADFQYRGVSLGGWLVLEPFITPSLFLSFNETSKNPLHIPKDEYSFCARLGRDEARNRLQAHWRAFYLEVDFKEIRDFGFNMVRIPVGYWAFAMLESDPYVSGAQEYLDKAIEWAHKYDLKVWIDLHGAPGSQNGFDNSGKYSETGPMWQREPGNVALTEEVLRTIYTKYGSPEFSERFGDTILGIEVLNEPFGPSLSLPDLRRFYEATYIHSRAFSDTNFTIAFSDAFQPAGYWNDFKSTPGDVPKRLQNYNILIDHHHYEIFSEEELRANISQHVLNVQSFAARIHSEAKSHPVVVGEWSGALTDCAPWINSVGFGSRWEGTPPFVNAPINNTEIGNCSEINNWASWSEEHKNNTRRFVEIQLEQYETLANGWIFWTFKTETSIEWDFKRLAAFGLFPQPFSDRHYYGIKNDTKDARSSTSRSRRGNGSATRPWNTMALVVFLICFSFF